MNPKFLTDPTLFRLLAERARDYAIFLLDVQGNVMSWNIGAHRIKGYEEAEIVGRHFSVFYPPEAIALGLPAHALEVAAASGSYQDEGWRMRRDGSRFWASVTITALRDDAGELRAFSKITRDMTERRRQEQALRESEERFRLLVEGVSDYAIYMLDPNGIVTSWNLGARRIKGYEAREIIGQHFSRFYDAEAIAQGKPQAELAMAREHGRAEDEGWRVRSDGSRFWAKVVVTALYDSEGHLRGFAKVTQDLTQRRHSEALEVATQKTTDFIAVLAHELRNPLAPIRNAVHLLKMAQSGDPMLETVRQIIDRQSAQLSRLVDDLLDVSRVTRGTLEIRRTRLALDAVVSRAVETARPGIDEGGHTLAIERSGEPLYVDGDEVRLTQALTNILNNAARYSERGGRITVNIRSERGSEGASAVVCVRDTGYGIDPALLGSIFGMFVQGRDPLHRSDTGLGIGLALARSIVELHHGTLEARSEGLGKGSEFVIRLPLAQPPRPATHHGAGAADEAAAGRSILVVDDNIDAAVTLSALMRAWGHEVRIAHDGTSALRAFEEFEPDAVLLDIGMPGMNGLQVAAILRTREPRPLLVAVTGWGKPDDERLAHEAGFDFHFVKPVDEGRLMELLARESPDE